MGPLPEAEALGRFRGGIDDARPHPSFPALLAIVLAVLAPVLAIVAAVLAPFLAPPHPGAGRLEHRESEQQRDADPMRGTSRHGETS